MKKRNLQSLALNKCKISELQKERGGLGDFTTDQPTASTCTCVSCLQHCQEPIRPATQKCER